MDELIGKTYIGEGPTEDYETTFSDDDLPEIVRFIPGMMTRDYRPERLNIELDENNVCVNTYYG